MSCKVQKIGCLARLERLDGRGQSLVEVAIFLPILVFLLAGVVEVGNVLNAQNKVTTSARMGAGFGAANFDPDDWPSTADAMGVASINTVTDTMDTSPDLWDIWSIRALTNALGDGFDVFSATHVYGNNAVISSSEWITLSQEVQADILAELQSTGLNSAKELEVVASVNYHSLDTILGLPVWQWTGMKTVRGLTVMRVGEKEPYDGCPILPITIRLDQYSSYPSNWDGGRLWPSKYPGDNVPLFPEGSGPHSWEYPDPPPAYVNQSAAPAVRSATFRLNVPGVPLLKAQPYYIYWAREQGGSGNFGWLTWDGSTSASDLTTSLTFPGDFLDKYPGSRADKGNVTNLPPGEVSGDDDKNLEVGEWLEGSTGNIASSEGLIQGYVDDETPVTLIVYDIDNGGMGSGYNYRVAGFMTVRLIGYSFQGDNPSKWIVFEVRHWGSRCSNKGAPYP